MRGKFPNQQLQNQPAEHYFTLQTLYKTQVKELKEEKEETEKQVKGVQYNLAVMQDERYTILWPLNLPWKILLIPYIGVCL